MLLALPALLLPSALAAQETAGAAARPPEETAAPVWAFETSDVPLDTGYILGRLDNGMRYIIRRNATPEGTALVRMRIASGSLEETDSERGLSHYLEHMAFNGSKGIPEGEMIKLLEREGLAFGADTNASTGFEAITYMLNLPRNDEALLGTALMLMRETASELTISDEAVARERGVILAERRDRAGFQQRNFEDNIAFLAPGARYAERLPIGTIEVLETANAAQIRALYERTYVPANTVLVVIGDYPVELVEAAIRARFADWQAAPAPLKPVTGPIDVSASSLTDIYLDPALSESVTISRLAQWRAEPDTLANRRAARLRAIGYAIVNRRLARLARMADAPFRAASFGSGNLFEDARITTLTISSVDGEWKKGMLAGVREVNQALTYGFTQAEIDEQIANIRTALENAAKAADTRGHSVFMGGALALVSDDQVPTTPEWQIAEFERSAPGITPQTVWQAVLDDAAPLEEPLIRFAGRNAPEGGEAALRSAFDEGMALPISAPTSDGPAVFGYDDFGAPGAVIADSTEDRFGIRRIRFANGVRLNLKRTDVRKDRIQVLVRVDGGTLLATRDDPLRVYLVDSLAAGGLGRHDLDQLQTVLAGRSVAFGLSSQTDAFAMGGTTTPRDLELQMQVIAALLTDPGYRSEGVEQFRKGIDNFFRTLTSTPARAYGAAAGALLSDGDPRFSLQSQEAYLALDYDGLKAAISDRLATGAIEVAMVGDLDEDAAIAAVAATLGALPAREAEFQPRDDARQRSFTPKRGLAIIEHQGEADQAQLRFIWPTTDDEDQAEDIRLSLLARVVRLELTDRLREELGQAYSPSASSATSSIYPGYGTFSILASIDVNEVEAARTAVLGLLADLREVGPSADLLERARKPVLDGYNNALKDLGGWMRLAGKAQSDPLQIDRWLRIPELVGAVQPEEIRAVALQYLDPAMAVEIRVVPARDHSADEQQESPGTSPAP